LLNHFAGRDELAAVFFGHYNTIFAQPLPDRLSSVKPLAVIDSVADNAERETLFHLQTEGRVRIIAVGEGTSKMWDNG